MSFRKLTYNFKTDHRLKRGLNLGVVYVTNETLEEEPQQSIRRPNQIAMAHTTDSNERKKKDEHDNYNEPPPGKCREEIRTSPVLVFTRPKPLTFEFGAQTLEKWRDKPEFVPYWPKQEGIEEEVQVGDGDLFCFDEEVKPILNVLTGKILEKSRMEVLEEEEIKQMKAQQRFFQNLKSAELREIREREKEELERTEKNEANKKKKMEIKENMKIFQKKLFARTLAKEYLNNMKHNTFNYLIGNNLFINYEETLNYNKIGNSLKEDASKLFQQEGKIVKELGRKIIHIK